MIVYTVEVRSNGYQVWSQHDLACMLHAVMVAVSGPLAAVPDNPGKRAYIAGFEVSLSALCAAFGLALVPQREPTRELTP